MPRPNTRHSTSRSTPMTASFSTASSAAADEFGGLSLASGSSPLSSRHSTASPSPTPFSGPGPSSTRSRGNSSTSSQSGPKRKERQTRLQEHLRSVKPGSNVPKSKPVLGFAPSTSSASKTLPRKMETPAIMGPSPASSSSRPKRKAAQKVVMQELEVDSDPDDAVAMEGDEEEDAEVDSEEEVTLTSRKAAGRRSRGRNAGRAAKTPREREISSLSTVSAGIDVEGMDEDEVENRLEKEKNELMERLAQHGINPQADVLDQALRTLSSSNEKLTVESFLRALSSLDSVNSPNSARLPLPLPVAPPALTVQVPNGNQAKRVSFSTLESPSTPSSSHSNLFPSPPAKSASLPVSAPLAQPGLLLPAFHSKGPVSPTHAFPVPSTSAAATAPPAPQSASLFGNSLPGMGRIALTRRHTYLGVPSASDPVPSLLPAFEQTRQSAAPSVSSSSPVKASVSKLQSWLDDDDSEEEDSVVKPSNGRAAENKDAGIGSESVKADGDDEEEMEIRVGGKTVKVLRKRRLEESEVQEEEDDVARSLSAKGKGKQRALECLCGEGVSLEESSHGTVSCGLCDTSFHLACLNVNSRRHLPLEWTCERCQSVPAKDVLETPQKRPRTGPEMTPPLSNEPTFVTGSFSPIPRGNFSACPDVALAPSPTSSPKRHFAAVPTSPVLSSSKVAIPATPHFGKDSDPRSDYSPCSPLFNRKSRSRLVSGVFDSAPFANDWAAENAAGGGHSLFENHHSFADSLNPHDWHDVTMTPSRGLGQSNGGGSGWETPFASSRSRQPSMLHPQTLPHLRTPSQDIFSGSALDYVQGGRHTAPAQMFTQRLFGEDPSASSPSRNHNTGSSPHGLKRAYRHSRNPSSSYILPSHAFASPSSSASIFSQFPPTPHSAGSTSLRPTHHNSLFPPSPTRQPQSASMKSSLSAPGMLRSGSDGLGIGFDEQGKVSEATHFDDLLLS